MSLKNLAGVILCAMIFGASFLLGDGAARMFNGVGLLIVLSGTLGATLLSYPLHRLRQAVQVAWNSYRVPAPETDAVVHTLMELSLQSRSEGFLSLQEAEKSTSITFLSGAIGMLVDGYRQEEIRDILGTEMVFFRERRRQHERVFRHMARLAPAFGVCGSVVGLIGMLAGIGDTTVVLKTIPVALTSTLYGILLSNFLLTPVAESIHHKTEREMLLKQLTVEGIAAIHEEQNSHKLQKKLESFLTPSDRPEQEHTFDEMRREFYRIRTEREKARGAG